MRKIFISLLGFFLILISGIIGFLSIYGYETDRFNNFIEEKTKDFDSNLTLELQKIKFKLDLKKLKVFLNTSDPKVVYFKTNIPLKEMKIYLDFMSLLSREIKIDRTNIALGDLEIKDLKKIIISAKPSTLKSFILNNVDNGRLNGTINLLMGKNFNINEYTFKGYVQRTDIKLNENIFIEDSSFNIIADNKLVLLNSISFTFHKIPVSNGSLKINMSAGHAIDGALNIDANLVNGEVNKIGSKFLKHNFIENPIKITGNILTEFALNFDKTLKLKDYNFTIACNLENAEIDFNESIKTNLLSNEILKLGIGKSLIKVKFDQKQNNIFSIDGFYYLNDSNNLSKIKIENKFNKINSKLKINFDLNELFTIDLINYSKQSGVNANIDTNLFIGKKEIKINDLNYIQKNTKIILEDIKMDKKFKLKSLKKVKVKTYNKDIQNNNFEINFGKKIEVKGEKFDASNLIKNLNKTQKTNTLNNFNKDIQISFNEVLTKFADPLNSFNLIGKIEKGKFIKISSKSEFSSEEFLDISLKKDKNSKKKTLEIFSSKAKPILGDINFFKNIEGGQLLFLSTFDDAKSESSLQLKDFKVMKAPAFAKLLALADLGGIAVLLSGEGLGFESLEIKFKDENKFRSISEIYAVGPSLTILMDGYVDQNTGLTSLRGTMVPAKEINKLISKIPILGDILIGKEIGEGIFGVSFKMKGLPGKIKTTVNPIKTLTPRFITRALEKRKKNN